MMNIPFTGPDLRTPEHGLAACLHGGLGLVG